MGSPDSVDSDEFIAQFMDDYYAECDEHIVNMKRSLLALEAALDEPLGEQFAAIELFRALHTVKGLSGMVRVGPAERLAHALEDYLRGLRDRRAKVTPSVLGLVSEGLRLLEQIIAARRANVAMPPIEPFFERLGQGEAIPRNAPQPLPLSESSSAPRELASQQPPQPEGHRAIEDALRRGLRVYLCRFTPSAEFASRGVGVDMIRRRLGEIGEILAAVPRVVQGGVTFEFTVATDAEEAVLATLKELGVQWESLQAPEPPSKPVVPPTESRNSTPTPSLAPPNVVRVDLARLDELLRGLGDLVISRARLEEGLRALESKVGEASLRSLYETNQTIERQLRSLRESIMRIRMVPIGEVFQRMHFAVHDLAREAQKQVSLRFTGHDTEMDKMVVERMMDPLLHLVRNAVSHGLESPEERVRCGKPPVGTLSLRARAAGDSVYIEVEDDGRGIDIEQVVAKARAMGLVASDATLDEATLLDVLCAPGFSTREDADRAAGRGMGMAVVRSAIQELGGTLSLRTERGKGTWFGIQLPLTLAIMNAFLIVCGGRIFAVPQPNVREIIPLDISSVTVLEKNEIVVYRGSALPLVWLARLFNLPISSSPSAIVLVVGEGANSVGIVVDRIVGQREIVVRALSDPLVQVPGVSGATELGDGRVVLILDTVGLLREARRPSAKAAHRGASLYQKGGKDGR